MNEKIANAGYLPETQFHAEVFQSPQPVLVVFATAWSQPCQVLDAVLGELQHDCRELLKVVKINADAALDLSLCYDIQSVPTLLCFVGGKLRFRIVGTATKEAILAKLKACGGVAPDAALGNGTAEVKPQP